MTDSKDSGQSPESPSEAGAVVLRPRGLRGLLPPWRSWGSVRFDFDRGELAQGSIRLSFDTIAIAEIRNGIFAASDGIRWICFDPLVYRDAAGENLMGRDGSLSSAFSRLFYRLQQSLTELGRIDLEKTGGAPVQFDFSYRVRVDWGSIVLGFGGLAAFVAFERHMGRDFQLLLDMEQALWFVGAVGAFVLWLFFWRFSSRLRVDATGIRLRRAFIPRFYPWETIRAVRHQGLEVEFQRRWGRVSLNLEVLQGRGSPLLLRRAVRPALTPLGSIFLRWIGTRVPQREEVPVIGNARERLLTRIWTFFLVAANVWMFFKSDPPSVFKGKQNGIEQAAFGARLDELGARTAASFEEPWRFFTALFLHANLLHIGFNMLILASLAPWLMRIFGLWRGTIIYLGSGVLGNVLAQLLHQMWKPEMLERPSVGASTAVLGIIGALLGGIYRRPYSVPLAARARFRWAIPVVFLLTLGMDSVITITDTAAHFCGFVMGFVLALVVPPRPPAVS